MPVGTAQGKDESGLPIYAGLATRHVAMPLGGIGAGQIALGGDGGLRQWQIFNQINHVAFVPGSFFAIRTTTTEPPLDVVRILQSNEILDRDDDPTPLVTDDYIPRDQRELLSQFPGVDRTTFQGPYPFARLSYEDAELPVELSLEAFSPFVPLDARQSGLPAIMFTFTVRNLLDRHLHVLLGASLQNAVGWDGITPISGVHNPLYGGNVNKVRQRRDHTSIVMENPSVAEDHPGAGQMVLTALGEDVRPYVRWTDPAQFVRFVEGYNPTRTGASLPKGYARYVNNRPVDAAGPSPAGQTWNGGLGVPLRLQPGEQGTATFVISWHFPNRYLNFDQPGRPRDRGKSRFWLGNDYANRYIDAVETAEFVAREHTQLREQTRNWEAVVTDSTAPGWVVETIAAQGSLMRSPTTFWTEDGRFYGFEGSLGASTAMWNASFGGSCPLNCTHVWNYEMALSRLFPDLERSIRETEFEHAQAPEGYIPHRTIVPLYLKQLWDEPIGGPHNPALDGMLGAVLKLYREVRQSGDRAWLSRLWPRLERLMAYIFATWDENGDGVLEGEQGNTYDIAFYGPNIFIGGLWLAALRAGEEMARLMGREDLAQLWRERFELGTTNYDTLLWNGEYYIQLLDESTPLEDQFGEGCLADQMLGQWWAHVLNLGYVLPEEHVKTTLRSIVTYNTKQGFRDFEHGFRVYADRDDTGLLICTWPHGGRPEVPVRYCDEVWTGIEYQVAAHCIWEGMADEGLEIVRNLRARHDGTRRNPYNEIECGDHYSRAMAGWTVLDALSGLHYDGTRKSIAFGSTAVPGDVRYPFVVGTGWGTFARTKTASGWEVDISCAYGSVTIETLRLRGVEDGSPMNAFLDGQGVQASPLPGVDGAAVSLPTGFAINAGQTFRCAVAPR